MKNRFSHIFNLGVVVVLLVGLTSHLAVPFFGDVQKTAFTQWLSHNVIVSENSSETELRNSIKELPKSSIDFQALLKQASELVANHKDQFKISPFPLDQDHEHTPSWLIDQWSMFKNHKSGLNAVIPELFKAVQKWLPLVDQRSFISKADKSEKMPPLLSGYVITNSDFTTIFLSPFIHSISINAP